jgi:hypothetical protein
MAEKDGLLRMSYKSDVPLKSAQLHYTTETGKRSDRKWNTVEAKIEPAAVVVTKPPANANTWFITLTDDRGAMISSPIQFQQKK